MSTTEIVVFSSVLGGIFLLFSVINLVYWARFRGLEDSLVEVDKKTQVERLAEVENDTTALLARVDQFAVDNSSFKNQVHKELQRFDQIMRRMKTAADTVATARRSAENGEDNDPDEIPLEDATPRVDLQAPMSRADLRKLWREKHPSE